MSSFEPSYFEQQAGPVIDELVERFGSNYRPDVVKDYSTLVLGINTFGEGIHPEVLEDLMEHLKFIAENVTTTVEPLPDVPPDDAGNDLVTMEDIETRERLIGDEELNLALLGAFKKIWPDGRSTNTSS